MKQQSFSMKGYFDKGKKTRREEFLAEMDQVMPWQRLLALIEPHYPKGSSAGGRPALPLERMLRIYCLQQWYNLSDPGAEEALYDSITMRHFTGVCSDADVIPDETSILNFRRLLEKHELTARLLAAINAHLSERGLPGRSGSVCMTHSFSRNAAWLEVAGLVRAHRLAPPLHSDQPLPSLVPHPVRWFFGEKSELDG
jgi:hypothetical protein